MKHLIVNIVPVFFILLAAYILYLGRDGWGWCLFCAVLTVTSITTTYKVDDDKSKKENTDGK